MATNCKNASNDARTQSDTARKHSDAARKSSDTHTRELGRMQESAIEAARDTADRTTRRRNQLLRRAAAKGV